MLQAAGRMADVDNKAGEGWVFGYAGRGAGATTSNHPSRSDASTSQVLPSVCLAA